jgi:hypothetical protein
MTNSEQYIIHDENSEKEHCTYIRMKIRQEREREKGSLSETQIP